MMNTTIRLALQKDAKAVAQIHYNSWIDAYRSLLPDAFFAEVSLEKTTSLWEGIFSDSFSSGKNPKDTPFTLVAEGSEGIVGFIHGGKSRDLDYHLDAEIYSIYVRPDQQRSGIGSLLLRNFAEHLKTAGAYHQIYAWVLRDAPAAEFFSSLGASRGREITEETGVPHIKFHEVKYFWPNIKV